MKTAQIRAAQLAPQILKLVVSEPEKAYPTSLTDRLKAQGVKTNTIEVRRALDFLNDLDLLTALPVAVARNSGERPRRMYAPTLRGHFTNAQMAHIPF